MSARTRALAVGRTMLLALAALPLRIVASVQEVRNVAVPRSSRWSRMLTGMLLALGANVAAIVAVFALTRP